jgi:hypothetical protein
MKIQKSLWKLVKIMGNLEKDIKHQDNDKFYISIIFYFVKLTIIVFLLIFR